MKYFYTDVPVLTRVMFAVSHEYASYAVFRNLHQSGYGGFQDFRYSTGKDHANQDKVGLIPTFITSNEHPLDGKVLIYSSYDFYDSFIVNAYTLDVTEDCNAFLAGLLDGYDGMNSNEGKPRLIIMHLTLTEQHAKHNIILAIEPFADGTYAVSCFDSLGKDSAYNNVYASMRIFFQRRYNTEMRCSQPILQRDGAICPILSSDFACMAFYTVVSGLTVYDELDNLVAALGLQDTQVMQARHGKMFDDAKKHNSLYWHSSRHSPETIPSLPTEADFSVQEVVENDINHVRLYNAENNLKLPLLPSAPKAPNPRHMSMDERQALYTRATTITLNSNIANITYKTSDFGRHWLITAIPLLATTTICSTALGCIHWAGWDLCAPYILCAIAFSAASGIAIYISVQKYHATSYGCIGAAVTLGINLGIAIPAYLAEVHSLITAEIGPPYASICIASSAFLLLIMDTAVVAITRATDETAPSL